MKEKDLNGLIVGTAARLAPAAQGRLALDRGSIAAEASFPLPSARWFVHFLLRIATSIDNDRLKLRVE